MNFKYIVKQKKLMISALFAVSLTMYPLSANNAEAFVQTSPYAISFEDETSYGVAVEENYRANSKKYTTNKFVNILQDFIVWSNQDELAYKHNTTNGRYLRPIHVIDNNDSNITAETQPGGYIFVTQGLLDFINVKRMDGYNNGGQRENVLHSLYNNSALSFVIAHEMSHWANMDFLRHYNNQTAKEATAIIYLDKKSNTMTYDQAANYILNYDSRISGMKTFNFDSENRADIKGMEYLDNYGVFSGAGGALMFLHRMEKLEAIGGVNTNQEYNQHPTARTRINRVMNYISRMSNNRVSLDANSNLRVDGKLLNSTGKAPDLNEVYGKERTFYVAGQIANAIHNNAFHKSNLKVMDLGFIYVGENINLNGQCALVAETNSGKKIILDKFYIDVNRMRKIIDGSVKPENSEEQYAYNFVQMI